MNSIEEHAKVLLEQTNFNKSEALTLLRKRLTTRIADGGAYNETTDQAFLLAIEIDHQYLQHLQYEMVAQNKQAFRERFGELFPK